MAKTTKKLISLLIAMVMVLSLIPAVYAEGETTEPETETVEAWNKSPSKSYSADEWIEVGSAADWDAAFNTGVGVNSADYDEVGTVGVQLTADVTLSPNEVDTTLWVVGSDSTRNVVLDLGGHTLAVKSVGATCRMIRFLEVKNGSDLTVINGKVEIGAGLLSNGGFVRTTSADSDITLDGADVQLTITSVGSKAKMGMFAYLAPGNLTMINSRVQHTGTATMADDGGLINLTTGNIVINNSHLIGGKCADRGGNIYASAAMNLTVTGADSRIADGTATNRGGNLYDTSSSSKIVITDGTFTGGTVTGSGAVGANVAFSGTMVITGGTFDQGTGGGFGRCISIFNASATPATKLYIYGGNINGHMGANNTYADGLIKLYGGTYVCNPTDNYQASKPEKVDGEYVVCDWMIGECCELFQVGNRYVVGHKDNDTTQVTQEATCAAAGSKTTTCDACATTVNGTTYGGGTYTVAIPMAAHTEEVVPGTPATCTTPGLSDGSVCSVCGETLVEQTEIGALGHTEADPVFENEVAADCETAGAYDSVVYCSVCGEELSRETIVGTSLGHTEADPVIENEVAATCTAGGSYDSVVYCSVCGDELSRETITTEAAGHSEAEAVKENEVAATCTAGGSYDSVVYCSVCGDELTRETITTEAAGHDWDDGVYTAPTTEADGYTTYTCTVCGETKVETDEGSQLTATEITGQPESATTVAGDTATFTVTAEGDGLNYQWQYAYAGKTNWMNTSLTGATSATLSVGAYPSRDGYKYRCVITDSSNNLVRTEVVTLTVTMPTGFVEPQDATAATGETAQFTVGTGERITSFQWQYAYAGKTNWMNTGLTGNKTATLSVGAYAHRDGYKYRCVVTLDNGYKYTTEAATLTVE